MEDEIKLRIVENIVWDLSVYLDGKSVLEIACGDSSVDVSVCYNALGHLKEILNPVVAQMIRVTTQEGYIIFITMWKMDKIIVPELKSIIHKYSNITICEEIENNIEIYIYIDLKGEECYLKIQWYTVNKLNLFIYGEEEK